MPLMQRLLASSFAAVLLVAGAGVAKTDKPAGAGNGFVCGTSAERNRNGLAVGRYRDSLVRQAVRKGAMPLQQTAPLAAAATDIGDVALIEDDGTMILPANPFRLVGVSFRFVPFGAGAYSVARTSTAFNAAGATPVSMEDDDTSLQNLGFAFPFFGANYSSVQLNSDGNLTFLQPDTAHTARDLGRFSSGPPRIGPLFADLDPSSSGSVSVRVDADGVLFAWSDVPNYGTRLLNSFSVKLFRSGSIEFVYSTSMATPEAVVGISPGSSIGGITAVDFVSGLPTGILGGTLAEVFSSTSQIVETAVAKAFFKTHPDTFDQLIMFLDFGFDLGGGAFAYELNVKNDVQGIALQLGDNATDYGSNGRLYSFVDMGSLDGPGRYPFSPTQVFLGTNSTVTVLGQEAGHRWLAFTPWRDGTVDSDSILGRDLAHWSFFFNSFASVMEGNWIQDNGVALGNNRFSTIRSTATFSLLDQYIMGLAGPDSVTPSFVVVNPTGTSASASSPPRVGVSFGGTRKDVTIDSIIAANGPRVPSVHQSPKVFREAFILLTQRDQTASTAQIQKVQRIRDAWVDFFSEQTAGRGWVVTDLQNGPATTPTSLLFPFYQGNSQRYTGLAVANWGPQPADVLFTAYDNSGNQTAAPGQIINPRVVTVPPGAQIALLGSQIFGLSVDDVQNGWIRARSTSSQVASFFLDGDIAQTMLNGAVAGSRTDKTLYFTRAQVAAQSSPGNSYKNLINIVNPNAQAAQVTLTLVDDTGRALGQAVRSIRPQGRMAEDLPQIFALPSQASSQGYIAVTGDQGIVGYQSIDSGTTLFSLPAQPAASAVKLYSAQFASGGAGGVARYFTELNVVNTSDQPRALQVLLVGDNGSPVPGIPNPAVLNLAAHGRNRSRGERLFGLPDPALAASIVQGSLVVTCDGPGVIGDVLFGDAVSGRFLASLPLDANPAASVVLAQVAQGAGGGPKPYYTGVAIYNPNESDVSITLDVYSEQGMQTGNATFPLARGARLSKTLPELVPAISEQLRGYIRISSTLPIVSFELFGDQYLEFLAPVPAQPIAP